MVVYDVTDASSFENVKNWMQEINKFANENVCVILVGNKCDTKIKRKVTIAQGQALAKEFQVPYLETSAKSGLKIEEAFQTITNVIYKNQKEQSQKAKNNYIPNDRKVLSVTVDDKKSSCCA